jgi:hypothetical protein
MGIVSFWDSFEFEALLLFADEFCGGNTTDESITFSMLPASELLDDVTFSVLISDDPSGDDE